MTFAPLRIIECTAVYNTYQERIADPSSSPRHVFPDDARCHELYRTGLAASSCYDGVACTDLTDEGGFYYGQISAEILKSA